ncbi:hypothetical protein H6F88_18675 [Oculatella sp. FACHB-28]|uniref:hypothetical protein n=1 Tax=Cyanophyceae TaxID=3028117 RepID=UPI001689456F|nr:MULTISPECIES: hypothetical protein [Cyanophyceae]MBD2058015.1 hypothetical protein [Oculatella sp. FACHB-28]MBD2068454.1 hypothetical protein [Leptolyngbya sp. FACHB-671]
MRNHNLLILTLFCIISFSVVLALSFVPRPSRAASFEALRSRSETQLTILISNGSPSQSLLIYQ